MIIGPEPISRIDPYTNKLYFRGLDATELAKKSDYESVLYLLIHGQKPTDSQRTRLIRRMTQLRDLYTEDIQSLDILIDRISELREGHSLNLHDTLLTYVTICPFVVAAQYTKSQSQKMKEPNKKLGYTANFLWMTKGTAHEDRSHDVCRIHVALRRWFAINHSALDHCRGFPTRDKFLWFSVHLGPENVSRR